MKRRTGNDLKRRRPIRNRFDRVLIVCEGEKTEPNYLEEIRQDARISTLDIKIISSALGTEPKQIVESAENEFLRSREYERIYVVFDRDDHQTYANAIDMSSARHQKYKNDEGKLVSFEAVVTVPCFELWLLIHFVDVRHWLHRDDVIRRLRQQIPGYSKGNKKTYSGTATLIDDAIRRGTFLKNSFSRLPGNEPYTDMHELVHTLRTLKSTKL